MRLITIILYLAMSLISSAQSISIFVSKAGNDRYEGSLTRPFATIDRALSEIASIKKQAGGILQQPVTINLREGVYEIEKTIDINNAVCGNQKSPLTIQAYNKEQVSFNGGKQIPTSALRPVTDLSVLKRLIPSVAKNIRQINLKDRGITDFGVIHSHGFRRPYYPSAMEIFLDKKPLQLARYPNDSMMLIGHLVAYGSAPVSGDFANKGGAFNYENKRINRWHSAPDAWMGGYFNFGYADDELPVEKLDTIHQIIYSNGPTLFGFSSGSDTKRWYIYNLIEELDMPGEYYIDREQGILYLIPPSATPLKDIEVSLLEDPMISLKGTSYVIIKNIGFENTRGIAIYEEAGTNNKIENCSFRNIGETAIVFGKGIKPFPQLRHEGTGEPASEIIGSLYEHLNANSAFDRMAGTSNGIINCTIKGIGMGGVILGGGNRVSLDTGNNYVENCVISDFNRLGKSYKGGVNIDGVGNIVTHCHIYDAPHTALYLHGNNHKIYFNEINDVCKEAEDMGAVYIGRDPSEAGNDISKNYFHNIVPKRKKYRVTGVYLDDGSLLNSVTQNYFYKCGSENFGALFIHGGFANIISNNVFIDCDLAVGIAKWDKAGWDKYVNGDLWKERLQRSVNITKPPYSTSYPTLANLVLNFYNKQRVSNNLVVNCKLSFAPALEASNNFITNHTDVFVGYQTRDFTLKSSSFVFKNIKDFETISFHKIGLASK